MNKIITLCFAFIALCAGAKDYIYTTPLSIKSGSVIIEQLDSNIDNLKIHVRASAPDVKQGYKDNTYSWGVVLNYIDSLNYYAVNLSWHNTSYGYVDDKRYLKAELSQVSAGEKTILAEKQFEKNVKLHKGANSIVISTFEGRCKIAVGSSKLNDFTDLALLPDSIFNCGIITNTNIQLSRFQIKTELREPCEIYNYTIDSLKAYFKKSTDPLEGFWTYLDRNNNIKFTSLGGQYDLAIVKNNDKYDILYIDGATVCKAEWHQFQRKGTLKPTIFENNYDLTWLDVRRKITSSENSASLSQSAILTLNFPLLKTVVRFKKVL